jgi:Protein of unknown function (DUF1329)
MKLKRRCRVLTLPFLLTFWFLPILSPDFVRGLWAAEVGLKPGDTIGPRNWQKVQGMVGENLLNRIKQGYTFKIKQPTTIEPLREYDEATEKYSSKVKLGPNGELLNYVAGRPFPNFDRNDSQAGQEVAWNFYWRWLGDDYKNAGALKEGKIIRYFIDRNGSERRGDVINIFLRTRNRVTVEPKPVIPGYEHIDWMQIIADEYPRDSSGTTVLEMRYANPSAEDDFYVYVPSLRRIRRAPPIQRCATIAPSEFNYDDVNSFNGKITDFKYRLLGEKQMLGNFSQGNLPFHRKTGDYLPFDEDWEIHDTYVLEITPKNPEYCYPRKVLYLDKIHFETLWTMIWDREGKYWKEQFAFRYPLDLPDRRQTYSVGTVVIVNVQNGRSTLVTVGRNYNYGYRPSFFTLTTLQTVMRGGTIR